MLGFGHALQIPWTTLGAHHTQVFCYASAEPSHVKKPDAAAVAVTAWTTTPRSLHHDLANLFGQALESNYSTFPQVSVQLRTAKK